MAIGGESGYRVGIQMAFFASKVDGEFLGGFWIIGIYRPAL